MLSGPGVGTRTSDTFENVGDLLIDRASRNLTSFTHPVNGTRPLGNVVASSLRLAKTLSDLEVDPGSRVALMLPNGTDFLISWFSCVFAGAIQAPLNIDARRAQLEHYLRLLEPDVVIAHRNYLDRLTPETRGPSVKAIIVVGGSYQLPDLGVLLVPLEQAVGNEELTSRAATQKYAPMSVLFTSGTTGLPKGAVISHSMAMWTGDQALIAAKVTGDDHWYCCLPFFHVDAQNLVTMSSLISGADVTIAERFSASRFWDDIERSGATRFTFIGAILEILLKRHPDRLAERPAGLIGIGSPVREHIYREFETRFRCELVDTFGMTEITNPIWQVDEHKKPGAAGILSEDYEIAIVDDEDRRVSVGEPGELLIRPKHAGTFFDGYYGMAQETVEAWRHLWFHTGDRVKRDAEGYIYFVERKKDVIRRRGENVSVFEIEEAVSKLPGVEGCAAVPVPAEFSEDEIRVFITRVPGSDAPSAEEVWTTLERALATYMVPRYVDFIEEFPLTPTSKLNKRELRTRPLDENTRDREAEKERNLH